MKNIPINDRWMLALNLRESGKTYKEIGDNMNVNAERARQIVAAAKRRIKFNERL